MFVWSGCEQVLQRLSSPGQAHYGDIQFTYWVQWSLFRQLRGASLYAKQHRIALKGDLPIGARRCFLSLILSPRATTGIWKSLAALPPLCEALGFPVLLHSLVAAQGG